MKTDSTLFILAAAAIAVLFYKAQSTSTPQGQGGAGGVPAWSATPGPMGPKLNPVTGKMEMQPLLVSY